MKVKINIRFKKNVYWILDFLTALFLILNCQSIWQNTVDRNYHIYEIGFILIIINSLYTALAFGVAKEVKGYILLISLVYYSIIFLVVIFSVSDEKIIKFLSRFLIFPFFLLYFCSETSAKFKFEIMECFINWAAIISWVTFILWGASTIGLINESESINVNWFGVYVTYHGLYFSSSYQFIDWVGNGIKRNIGIFTEGPMFMVVIILSLLFMLLIRDYYKPKKWKIIGLLAALISIASVTGFIFALIIGGICLIHRYKNKRKQILIGISVLLFFMAGVFILFIMKSKTASYIARLDDYLTGIKCWIQNPIVGNGYENVTLLRQFMSNSRNWNQGFSNTAFSVLAYGGILFAIPFFVPLVRGMIVSKQKHDYRLLIFSIVYTGLYFTVIFYTFYVNFLIWAFLMTVYRQYNLNESISNVINKYAEKG